MHSQIPAYFILAVPMILAEEYRRLIREAGFTLWDSETFRLWISDLALPICAAADQYDELIFRLKQCQPGIDDWQVYQKLVGEILTSFFALPLPLFLSKIQTLILQIGVILLCQIIIEKIQEFRLRI